MSTLRVRRRAANHDIVVRSEYYCCDGSTQENETREVLIGPMLTELINWEKDFLSSFKTTIVFVHSTCTYWALTSTDNE